MTVRPQRIFCPSTRSLTLLSHPGQTATEATACVSYPSLRNKSSKVCFSLSLGWFHYTIVFHVSFYLFAFSLCIALFVLLINFQGLKFYTLSLCSFYLGKSLHVVYLVEQWSNYVPLIIKLLLHFHII